MSELKIKSFEEFCEKVKNAFEDYFGDEYSIRLIDTVKNNGIKLRGITARKSDSNLSPTIYLNGFYDKYVSGDTFGALAVNIFNLYENSCVTEKLNMEFFNDFNKIKDRIVFKLINKDKNSELLNSIPHFECLDMAVVFYYLFENEFIDSASILIKNEFLKLWNVDENELYEVAKINTPKMLSMKVIDLNDAMAEFVLGHNFLEKDDTDRVFDEMVSKFIGEKHSKYDLNMLVLTNKKNIFGAACILYKDILKKLSIIFDSDIVVLPSSVHEVILLPAKQVEDIGYLHYMVKEVNETQLAPEEILSDSVYIFKKDEEVLDMAK